MAKRTPPKITTDTPIGRDVDLEREDVLLTGRDAADRERRGRDRREGQAQHRPALAVRSRCTVPADRLPGAAERP